MFRWSLCLGLLGSALLWQLGDPGQAHAQRGRGGSRPMMVQPMMTPMARPMMTPMVTPNVSGRFRQTLPAAPAIRSVTPTRTFAPRFSRSFTPRFDSRFGMGGGGMFTARVSNGTFDPRFNNRMLDPRVRLGGGSLFTPTFGGTFDPRFP